MAELLVSADLALVGRVLSAVMLPLLWALSTWAARRPRTDWLS